MTTNTNIKSKYYYPPATIVEFEKSGALKNIPFKPNDVYKIDGRYVF